MSKTHTDYEQSKKLAEILPIESADLMFVHTTDLEGDEHYDIDFRNNQPLLERDIPCWSLAALLDILKDNIKIEKTGLDQSDMFTYSIVGDGYDYKTYEHRELIDACYEMIVKLHEKNELVI